MKKSELKQLIKEEIRKVVSEKQTTNEILGFSEREKEIKRMKEDFNKAREEIKNFNTVLRGATMRILVTRLHDYIFHDDNAMVVPKDPFESFNILKWHQNNSVFDS